MNIRIPVLLPVLTILIISCSKDHDTNFQGVLIKGTLSSGIPKSSEIKSAENISTLTDATQVLLFNSSGGYELFTIENNSFAARAMQGTATALAFLNENNSYIGCLHSGGLNVLPLVSLTDGENTIIDLSTLTLEGDYVVPANNPIGTIIDLNSDEIERFRQLGSFFESLSKNIDADNDGKPDILDNKALYISTIFDVNCGTWGLNDESPQITDTSQFVVNYTIRIWGSKSVIPSDPGIILSGPQGSPYPNVLQSYYTEAPDGFISFFRRETAEPSASGSYFLPFENGIYSLVLDGNSYSLHYSNMDVKYYLVMAIPTIHTNELNEIVSVSVEYRDVNGTAIDPQNFVYQTMIQLNGLNMNQLAQIGCLWESPDAKTNNELYNFVPDQKIPASELYRLTVCYLDLVGNAYNIGFNK